MSLLVLLVLSGCDNQAPELQQTENVPQGLRERNASGVAVRLTVKRATAKEESPGFQPWGGSTAVPSRRTHGFACVMHHYGIVISEWPCSAIKCPRGTMTMPDALASCFLQQQALRRIRGRIRGCLLERPRPTCSKRDLAGLGRSGRGSGRLG
jgi:hypothetical protein